MKLHPIAKIPLFFLFALVALSSVAGVGLWILSSSLPDVAFLAKPEISFQITVRDWNGYKKPFIVGPANPSWTPLSEIPQHLRNAVRAGEDFSFYRHRGVDWFEVKESFRRNLETKRFARGASTITQQLAKNLFLSREKTLTRKIREVLLAWKLEKTLKKDRILELYLNIVELGDMVYGVGMGSRHHFGKPPVILSLRESAILAAMLPGPKVYDPARHPDRVMNRSDHLLSVMLKGGMITEIQYLDALGQLPFAEEPSSLGEFFPEPERRDEELGPSAEEEVAGSDQNPWEGEQEPVAVPIPEHGAGVAGSEENLPGYAPSGQAAGTSFTATPPYPHLDGGGPTDKSSMAPE